MKILVVGTADSWIKPVIDKTMIAFGDEVTVLSLHEAVKFKDFYEKNHIKVILLTFPRIKYIRTLFSGIFNIRKFIGYDMICFHYVSNLALCMMPFAKIVCKKVTASFWGSDIFRRKKRFTHIIYVLLKFADVITLSTPDMADRFHLFFGNGLDAKIRRTHYGLSTLELLKNPINTNALYMKYRIPIDKVVVAIGYNKIKEQQHLKVLKVINSLPVTIRNRIHLIFRLTYGVNPDTEYVCSIKNMAAKSGCSSSFFETFMTEEEIAEVTRITDIFIHAQTTDARSGSMCEHMYAGCLVLNPSWLQYTELKNHVFYLTYNTFDELGTVLFDCLSKKEESKYRDKLIANKNAVYELTSWEACINEWRDVYIR